MAAQLHLFVCSAEAEPSLLKRPHLRSILQLNELLRWVDDVFMLNILSCWGALCLPGSEERVLPFRSRFQPRLKNILHMLLKLYFFVWKLVFVFFFSSQTSICPALPIHGLGFFNVFFFFCLRAWNNFKDVNKRRTPAVSLKREVRESRIWWNVWVERRVWRHFNKVTKQDLITGFIL